MRPPPTEPMPVYEDLPTVVVPPVENSTPDPPSRPPSPSRTPSRERPSPRRTAGAGAEPQPVVVEVPPEPEPEPEPEPDRARTRDPSQNLPPNPNRRRWRRSPSTTSGRTRSPTRPPVCSRRPPRRRLVTFPNDESWSSTSTSTIRRRRRLRLPHRLLAPTTAPKIRDLLETTPPSARPSRTNREGPGAAGDCSVREASDVEARWVGPRTVGADPGGPGGGRRIDRAPRGPGECRRPEPQATPDALGRGRDQRPRGVDP